METLLQLLISGLATGSIFALAAIGFALLWQTSGTINFAQGEFLVLPAFIMLAAMELLDVGILPAFLISLPISMLLLGAAFKRILVDPLIEHGVLPLVIATIALGILMREGIKTFYSAEAQPFPYLVPDTAIRAGTVVISFANIVVLVIATILIVLLQLFLSRTFTGRCMEATAQNPETARILGINVTRMVLYTFLINAVLVTVAALLITPTYLAKFDNGVSLGLIAFIAAIVGGFNQVRGALIGGLMMGVLDNLSAFYWSTQYRNALPLILLILVILFRPQGLFGRAVERQI
jgi:branched-chain amino acid transport system permease protein